MCCADVVLPVPLPELFTYYVPEDLASEIQPGCRVLVPFGTKRTTLALVIRLHDTPPVGIELKSVLSAIDAQPVVLPGQLHFWQWMASYYLCTLGEVYKAALPAPLKKGREVGAKSVRRRKCQSPESALSGLHFSLSPLSPAQSKALNAIHASWQNHRVCLLHGVTSSGKTEIYMHLIEEAIGRGEQVLYLLPEIVLTTQLTDRLRAVFGDLLGVYHSKYSDGEREAVWLRQLSDHPYPLIVGVRSSIFLPFQRLGLVIIDEEHEHSFKQQEPAPRYHARDAAIMLASQHGARTLLGSATPSLESYYNVRTDKYALVRLAERFGQVSLPEVVVVDVSEARHKKLMHGPFSARLLAAIGDVLSTGRQVILFQNRRGYSPTLSCTACGWSPRCPHCSVPLTLHKRVRDAAGGIMKCHYCGFTSVVPVRCPACESDGLRAEGFGTERIEDAIGKYFPEARVSRLDLDSTRSRKSYESLIEDFAAHRTDILVGTQMLTKGLDFSDVSLVGILSAETMLNQPDFRAHERAFQLMCQVAGRAGRRDARGLVILQTRSPQLPLISQVISDDYESMYLSQMSERRAFSYPPFVRLVLLYMKHRDVRVVERLSVDAACRLRHLFGERVLGPDEPAVSRVSSFYIRRLIVKLEPGIQLNRAKEMLAALRSELLSVPSYSSAQLYYDVDPL